LEFPQREVLERKKEMKIATLQSSGGLTAREIARDIGLEDSPGK